MSTESIKISPETAPKPQGADALIALADGTVIWGFGFGAEGVRTGELVFNTAMTGYQEIMTDASYAGQILCFTFPHIGNVGTNDNDLEARSVHSLGMISREMPTQASNWRAEEGLPAWMNARGLIGLGGVDTRALTIAIRKSGSPHATIAYAKVGEIDAARMVEMARGFNGLVGLDLAIEVTTDAPYEWNETRWAYNAGYGTGNGTKKVVAVDYGAKHNILRCLASAGADVTVVPAKTSAAEILAMRPDGVFLSNGPGDPMATGEYAVPMIKDLLAADMPIFGICLGHQMLALALGAKTVKMKHGHHGANHPVRETETGKVEITSMNHGFAVDRDSLPANVIETHISLFDGTNCGIRLKDKPVFSVQQHPEASPGPTDSYYLFERFLKAI